jgi:hypothetical protein
MLMHADNRSVDHLDSGIVGSGKLPTIPDETVENDPQETSCSVRLWFLTAES